VPESLNRPLEKIGADEESRAAIAGLVPPISAQCGQLVAARCAPFGFVAYLRCDHNLIIGALMVACAFVLMGISPHEPGWRPKVTFILAAAAIALGGYVYVPEWLRQVFNHLGDLSYPLYLIYAPLIFAAFSQFGLHSYTAYVVIVLTFVRRGRIMPLKCISGWPHSRHARSHFV
jgi:peptidoglycan/LPS O-acetylase OafA/YrhL